MSRLGRWIRRIGCLIGGCTWERCPYEPACWHCSDCGAIIRGLEE